jgi:hypothetical protein
VRRVLVLAAGALLAGGLYLLLIDQTYQPELYVGVGVVALAVLAHEASRERDATLVAGPGAWLRELAQALARVPLDVLRLTIAAVGSPLRPLGDEDAFEERRVRGGSLAEQARREIVGSLSPGEIVVGHDDSGERMLVHRLWRKPREGRHGPDAGRSAER